MRSFSSSTSWCSTRRRQRNSTTRSSTPRSKRANVNKVSISGHDIQGELKRATAATSGDLKFTTAVPDDRDLVPELRKHNVDITIDNPQATPFLGMVVQIIPFVLMALLLLFILRQAQSGGSQALSFGRSRAKLLSENRPKVTFADVAGIEEAKEELGEVVEFLKYPEEVPGAGRAHPQGRAAARAAGLR